MVEQGALINLANCLARLEQARAAAPTASPTWKAIDAVEAASRDVIHAAHVAVSTSTTMHTVPATVPDNAGEPTAPGRYLRIGRYVLNMERVTYFEDTNLGLYLHYTERDMLPLSGEDAQTMRAYLDLHAEHVTWTVIKAAVQEAAR